MSARGEIKRLLEEWERLQQKIRNRIDRGEIVKPDSGNLVKDVLQAIEKEVTHYKPCLKGHQVPLLGSSGNRWTPDIVIENIEIEDEIDRVKAILECKNIKKGTKIQTYRSSHVPRAYTELADLGNWKKPLKFVIFSWRPDKGRGGFDFDALFRSIGAKIIDWSDDHEWFLDFILVILGTK